MKLFFPDLTYENVGGGQNLVYEIVKTAYVNKKIISSLIGSSKSFVLKRLLEDKIPFDFFEQEQFKLSQTNFSKDDLLVCFHNFDALYKFREFNGRSIIWGVLASQITNWNRFGFERKLTGRKITGDLFTKNLLRKMREKNSLICMDGATADAIEDFMGEKHRWPTIPIPVDISDIRCPQRRSNSLAKPFQISYIGRSGSVWKRKPVRKFMKDLAGTKNRNFKINIYTDYAAPFIEDLKELCGDQISVEYYIGWYGPKIRDHLTQNSDLHFSMGTAALEGGLAGLPTVLIDASYYDFPENYRYRWLHQTERYSLGRFIPQNEASFLGMTMDEVLEACFFEETRNAIAANCVQYVLENHSTLRVTEKLLTHPTQATMADICRFTPATWQSVNSLKLLFSGA